jgi:2,3-bisphosphoglycerate-dependent phosphoglycerate mutase
VQRIFTSNLQRAVKTAEAVAEAQTADDPSAEVVSVIQLPELREKNFGSEEGRRFGSRGTAPASAGWIEPESKESMKARCERFIDNHLIPTVLRGFHSDVNHSLAIVAHGIILNVLLRCMLARFGPDELTRLMRPTDTPGKMEWLASWSNTGYLEADLRLRMNAPSAAPRSSPRPSPRPSPPVTPGSGRPMLGTVVPRQSSRDNAVAPGEARQAEAPALEILMTVTTVNSTEHLRGLKKTRGGIGNSAFDQRQKTMDSFFITRSVKVPPPAKAPSPVKAPLPVKDTTPAEAPQPTEPSPPPVEAAQQVRGPRPQPPARTQPQPRVQPQSQSQPPSQSPSQPGKAPQPTQTAPPPTKAPQPAQPVQPSPAVQAVQGPRPARSSKPAASSRRAQVTRPIKAAEPATEPSEQVKSPPPAEPLESVKAPQPTEGTPPAKRPRPAKVTRPATEVSATASAAESAKVTQSAKVLRPNKVKRPIKKTKVFKKVRFVLPVKD